MICFIINEKKLVFIELSSEKYSRTQNTFFTVVSHPTLHADLVSISITGVMSKVVIPRATEFGAGCVVVMVITHHADSVYEAGCWTVVGDGVPVLTGQNDARVGSPLDQLTTICKS